MLALAAPLAVAVALAVGSPQVAAQTAAQAPPSFERGPVTGLPLPRWVTISSNPANMRRGPGTDYAKKYVYRRAGLPVEITAEFDHWRRIRDPDGAEGWMHKALIDGERSVIVTEIDGNQSLRPMFAEPDPASEVVALLEPGVQAHLEACEGAWCRVSVAERSGFMPRDVLWGVYPDETVP